MLNITLEPGAHKRVWLIEVIDAATGQPTQLPPYDDWHASVRLLNTLAGIYGAAAVAFYQWDITRVIAAPPEDPDLNS